MSDINKASQRLVENFITSHLDLEKIYNQKISVITYSGTIYDKRKIFVELKLIDESNTASQDSKENQMEKKVKAPKKAVKKATKKVADKAVKKVAKKSAKKTK